MTPERIKKIFYVKIDNYHNAFVISYIVATLIFVLIVSCVNAVVYFIGMTEARNTSLTSVSKHVRVVDSTTINFESGKTGVRLVVQPDGNNGCLVTIDQETTSADSLRADMYKKTDKAFLIDKTAPHDHFSTSLCDKPNDLNDHVEPDIATHQGSFMSTGDNVVILSDDEVKHKHVSDLDEIGLAGKFSVIRTKSQQDCDCAQ